jgi:hypothetical protein
MLQIWKFIDSVGNIGDSFWIGLKYTIDDEKFLWNSTSLEVGHSKWATGEPNLTSGFCVSTNSGFLKTWQTYQCYNDALIVCQTSCM